MSDQHTQGRLTASEEGYLLVETGHCLAAVGSWESTQDVMVDARRLAACWNAMEGLSTDAIERHGKAMGEIVGQNSDQDAWSSAARDIPSGWAMSTADFSIIANGGTTQGSVSLIRTGADRRNWHAFADADVIPLYVIGRGANYEEALRDAISQLRAAPVVPGVRP